MAENLSAPGFSDQIIVLKDAAMCFKLRAFLQCDDEMFVAQAHQLGEIAVARNGQ